MAKKISSRERARRQRQAALAKNKARRLAMRKRAQEADEVEETEDEDIEEARRAARKRAMQRKRVNALRKKAQELEDEIDDDASEDDDDIEEARRARRAALRRAHAAYRKYAQEQEDADDEDDEPTDEDVEARRQAARRRAQRRMMRRRAMRKKAGWDWQPDYEFGGAPTHYEGAFAFCLADPSFTGDGWYVQVFDTADEEAMDYGETYDELGPFDTEDEAKAAAEDMSQHMAARRRAQRRAMRKVRKAMRKRAQEDVDPDSVADAEEPVTDNDEAVPSAEAKRRRAARARALRKARKAMRKRAGDVSDDLIDVDGGDITIPQGKDVSDDLAESDEGSDMVQQTPAELPDSIDEAEDKVLAAYRLVEAQIARKVIPANVKKHALASKYAKKFTTEQMRLAAENLSKVGSQGKSASKGNVRVSKRSAVPYAKTAGKSSSMDDACLFF